MKGELLLKILEKIGQTAVNLIDLPDVFAAPYGSSLGRIRGSLYPQKRSEPTYAEKQVQAKKAYRDLLYRLRKDGLVTEGDGRVRLSQAGLKLMEKLKLRHTQFLPSPRMYESHQENSLKIIVFDIPEKQRGKRQWLRSVLTNLGYRLLQKSVWTGKAKIPPSLLEDFRRLDLLSHVEILQVTRAGSLRSVI